MFCFFLLSAAISVCAAPRQQGVLCSKLPFATDLLLALIRAEVKGIPILPTYSILFVYRAPETFDRAPRIRQVRVWGFNLFGSKKELEAISSKPFVFRGHLRRVGCQAESIFIMGV